MFKTNYFQQRWCSLQSLVLYLRSTQNRFKSNEEKWHVHIVSIKLRRATIKMRKKHEDANFAFGVFAPEIIYQTRIKPKFQLNSQQQQNNHHCLCVRRTTFDFLINTFLFKKYFQFSQVKDSTIFHMAYFGQTRKTTTEIF